MSVLGLVLFYRCLLIFNLNRPFEGAETNTILSCLWIILVIYLKGFRDFAADLHPVLFYELPLLSECVGARL
jgi:hypothetical protein